ncbi:hypothetical protein L1887_22595 [Cichorium endivia]|nr:hypothetical protein L1887_22595 [Cichorium endivia]
MESLAPTEKSVSEAGGSDGSSDGMKDCIGEEAAPGNGVAGKLASPELWAASGGGGMRLMIENRGCSV